MNRRELLKHAAILGAVSAVGTVGYTVRIEPHWLKVVRRDMPIDHLPAILDGARLIQISDLHVGPDVDDEYLTGAFADVAALRPDILVITGDFLTYSEPRGDAQFDQLRAVLAHLPRARLATVGVLGNHDYGIGWSEPEVARRVVAIAERSGVHMLRNGVVNVHGLDIIGVDDLWAHRANPPLSLRGRTSDAAITLCHNPDTLDKRSWEGHQGWILAGHTHGGQCKPPFLPPPMLPVENRRYTAGEIAVSGGRQLYINRGLGHLTKARFNVRPEITVFTLRAASAPTAGAG